MPSQKNEGFAFPYTNIVYETVDKRLPLLEVTVLGSKKQSPPISALVDSGSDINVFSLEILESLDIERGTETSFDGFGSAGMPGWATSVAFQVNLGGKMHQWRSTAIFTNAADRNVLGQQGFFDFFKVTFDRNNFEFTLLPY